MTSSDQWNAFERRVMEMAQTIRQAQAVKYADATPTDVARDLVAIDKALTTALQVLAGLALEHQPGQDLEIHPFNWPTVQALQQQDADPVQAIRSIRALRDAARKAAAVERPGRGNSADRREPSKRAASVGKNLVRFHRETFGELPPISKTGRVVDLLGEALTAAGLSEFDPADVLRRAVETMRGASV